MAADPYCDWCHQKAARCKCQEHIDCMEMGSPGHFLCGYCIPCRRPRYLCGHELQLLPDVEYLAARYNIRQKH